MNVYDVQKAIAFVMLIVIFFAPALLRRLIKRRGFDE